MNLVATLSHMYPHLKLDENYIIRHDEESGEDVIIQWKAPELEPSKQSLVDHWNQFREEIEKLFAPKPSQIDIIEQTQTDLIFQLMMSGAI